MPIISIEADKLKRLRDEEEFLIVAADLKGEAIKKWAENWDEKAKVLLAVGSEAEGISEYVRKEADKLVRIGHEESVESLNAAVAGSIIMMMIYDFGRKV